MQVFYKKILMFFSVFLTCGYSICNGYSVFALTRILAFPFLTVCRYMMMRPYGCATIYRYDMVIQHLPARITHSRRYFSAERTACSAEINAFLQKNSGPATTNSVSATTTTIKVVAIWPMVVLLSLLFPYLPPLRQIKWWLFSRWWCLRH